MSEDLKCEIRLLLENPKWASSNRLRDSRRKTLKRLGMITFDRPAWCWVVLPAGRAALSEEVK